MSLRIALIILAFFVFGSFIPLVDPAAWAQSSEPKSCCSSEEVAPAATPSPETSTAPSAPSAEQERSLMKPSKTAPPFSAKSVVPPFQPKSVPVPPEFNKPAQPSPDASKKK